MNQQHDHAEAYRLMRYRAEDGSEDEWIWNSRDGVTPFIVPSRDGTKRMQHIDWRNDPYEPLRVPNIGDRIFVDATEELARPIAEKHVEDNWERGTYPISEFKATKSEAVAFFVDEWVLHRDIDGKEHRGQPWLLTVTEEMRQQFQNLKKDL